MSASTPKPAKIPNERRRRRHPRYQGDFEVTVTHLLGDSYQKLQGHCRDLSQAGIGILLAAELNVGEVTSLSFSLSRSTSPWVVRAVVRYRRGYHYGFEFLSLTSDQQESLKSYINYLQPLD
jgi:PilZ domain